ncbi:MAG: primosomal protein N' [Planctomycetota bacterium]|nr:primosomal protein N' [Planctomycetota bacterium]
MVDHQPSLFEDDAVPWELDDRGEQVVATVVFPSGPAGEFDYSVPEHLQELLEPGRRVNVPLGRGNRLLDGYCIRVGTKPDVGRRLKAIAGVIDKKSLLSPSMLRLTEWIAEQYLCELSQVLKAVVPAGVRMKAGTRKATLLSPAADARERMKDAKLSAKQAAVMKVLSEFGKPMTPAQLARMAGCTEGPVKTLRGKGLITARSGRIYTGKLAESTVAPEQNLTLNADQRKVLDAIMQTLESRRHKTLLVHGVTGSGKTEVYIQAIQEIVGYGRQAIVLVPEISLTPQTLARFQSRFSRVAVLHSHLTDAERHWHWQQIAEGNVQVVVGARSAIFAPVPDLGLIVLDEEHESTFKQEIAPRYHAREVAIARAKAENVPLVLGSATPSLDSFHRAATGEFQLLDMPRRVLDRTLPGVDIVDLRERIHSRSSRGSISRHLHAAMVEALRDGGQIILMLNRRGYSTHIQCPACGHVMVCPDCEIALTHHKTDDTALCHYCDHTVKAPAECPECTFSGIRYSGQGTQRLEAEVKARFPNAPCLRMDTDTMRGRGSHQAALDSFRQGKVRILLGTQMIAKGLDFPDVTLVGVINADTALHLPDFRAAERTFQLVTQVAGRTGRGERGGRVLVQTFSPEHPAIVAAARHDYKLFTDGELPVRKMLSYPPFSTMLRFVIRGPSEQTTQQFAEHLADMLKQSLEEHQADARLLGPAPAPFAKLRGRYRFQIQVQGANADLLRAATRAATATLVPPEEVQWIVDVDPMDML